MNECQRYTTLSNVIYFLPKFSVVLQFRHPTCEITKVLHLCVECVLYWCSQPGLIRPVLQACHWYSRQIRHRTWSAGVVAALKLIKHCRLTFTALVAWMYPIQLVVRQIQDCMAINMDMVCDMFHCTQFSTVCHACKRLLISTHTHTVKGPARYYFCCDTRREQRKGRLVAQPRWSKYLQQ